MATVLRDTGVKVAVAEQGEEAIRLVQSSLETEHFFDLVLMDIRLPTIDGYETTRQLRRVGYQGPVIAITARAMEEEIEECHQAGCDACVSKPFDRTSLRETLADLLPKTVSKHPG